MNCCKSESEVAKKFAQKDKTILMIGYEHNLIIRKTCSV